MSRASPLLRESPRLRPIQAPVLDGTGMTWLRAMSIVAGAAVLFFLMILFMASVIVTIVGSRI